MFIFFVIVFDWFWEYCGLNFFWLFIEYRIDKNENVVFKIGSIISFFWVRFILKKCMLSLSFCVLLIIFWVMVYFVVLVIKFFIYWCDFFSIYIRGFWKI